MGQDQKKSRWMAALFLAGFVLPLMTGTTYVVLEGDREVGRFEEHDGVTDIQYVKNDAPKQSPALSAKEQVPIPSPLDLLGDPAKKYFDLKIEDPDLIRFLNRQPWMKKLREWDEKYDLEGNLGRYQPVFIWAIFGLLFLAIVFRGFRILHWFSSLKKK